MLINLKLTHQDIANMAGITRETATISIGKLKKAGIIDREGKMFMVSGMKK